MSSEDVKIDLQKIAIKSTLFNTLKLYLTLNVADALLRPITFLWILAALLICGPYVHNPTLYPIYMGIIISVTMNGAYQGLIGSLRRNTQKNLERLSAGYGHDLSKKSLPDLEDKLESEKSFKYSEDPLFVRMLFRLAKFFGIPRRGFLHQCVAGAQLFFLGLYVYNYVHYFGKQTQENFPEMLWMMHGAVTLIGIFAVIKNSSFLITSRVLLGLVGVALDPGGTRRRVADRLTDTQNTHSAIKGAMEEYRFGDNTPPPSSECEKCVKEMSVHVIEKVPLVLAPESALPTAKAENSQEEPPLK